MVTLRLVDTGDSLGKGLTSTPQETEPELSDSKSTKLLERNRERRKIVSATLEDLKECEEEEEDEEEELAISLSTSALSSLNSFKNKFQFSFSGRSKVRLRKIGREGENWVTLVVEDVSREAANISVV